MLEVARALFEQTDQELVRVHQAEFASRSWQKNIDR